MMRIRILTLLLAMATVAAACSDGPSRDATGSIIESGNASVFDLRTGDCFDDDPDGATQVEEVPVVPCAEPHDNEVFSSFQSTLAVYPGREEMLDAAAADCYDRFSGFVGMSYEDSELDFFPITPTEGSWGEGDREVLCVLYAMDLSKLTGTMRGSGR